MKVYCKTCQKVLGQIPDEKIPPNVNRYITCRICSERILLFRSVVEGSGVGSVIDPPPTQSDGGDVIDPPPQMAKSEGGYLIETLATQSEEGDVIEPTPQMAKSEGGSLIESPAIQSEDKNSQAMASDDTAHPEREGRTITPEFTGKAGEYFRIWIVNVFLTIVTGGIYAAWAKVRTRRYFYANTRLEGHSFDYLANPVAIFKGNMVLGIGFIIYTSSNFLPDLAHYSILGVIGLIFPFLIYKSLRFYAHNSAFRNIRFRFRGKLKESYMTYLLLPVLTLLTAGLILPYWVYRRKRYFFDNMAFGTTESEFAGSIGPFYRIHLVTLALAIVGMIGVFGLLIGSVGLSFFGEITSIIAAGAGSESAGEVPPDMAKGIIFILIIFYASWIFFVTVIQQYLFTRLTNYCWHHSRLGDIVFKSTIKVRRLVWIRGTNILSLS